MQAERRLTMTKQLDRSAQRAATGHRDGEAQRLAIFLKARRSWLASARLSLSTELKFLVMAWQRLKLCFFAMSLPR